jgi:crossover junction endodeoxyribonuclease RuvC
MTNTIRILGLDPGLRNTGWGIIEVTDNIFKPIACGVIHTNEKDALATRLAHIHKELTLLIQQFEPNVAAVEETFVNKNPTSTLKLGMARGVVLSAPAILGLDVFEYGANKVKKTVVGAGHAAKEQTLLMVKHILPGLPDIPLDASDALAVAICHASHLPRLFSSA